MQKKIKGVFAAGVTGGHIYPALAVAEEMGKMIHLDALFVGSGRGAEKSIYSSSFPFRHTVLPARGSDRSKFSYVFFNSIALLKAIFLLKKEKVDFVFTTGSYVGGVVAYAAHLLRIPIFIHESNVDVGVANIRVTRYAKISFCAFEDSAKHLKNARVSGTPVRKEFFMDKDSGFKMMYGDVNVLVFGGSEGSETIDKITEILSSKYPRYTFIHVGTRNVKGENVKNFEYVENMAYFMRNSDFVIARAGASTIAEIMAVKIPAILVPWSDSLNSHQRKNAIKLAKMGCALVLDENGEDFERNLSYAFEKLVKNADDIRENLKNHTSKMASRVIANAILKAITS